MKQVSSFPISYYLTFTEDFAGTGEITLKFSLIATLYEYIYIGLYQSGLFGAVMQSERIVYLMHKNQAVGSHCDNA